MNRLMTYALGALVVVFALPVLAAMAQSLVPLLVSVVVFLAIAWLAWPSPRRRR